MFDARVWAALRRIPRGRVTTYADLARAMGAPRSARAVAQACARNPHPVTTPCHRAVRSDGTLGGYSGSGGVARKRALLTREGIHIRDGRISDFAATRWHPTAP